MQLSCKYFFAIVLVVNLRLPQLWANAKLVLCDSSIEGYHCERKEPLALSEVEGEAVSTHRKPEIASSLALLAMTIPQITSHRLLVIAFISQKAIADFTLAG
jgi:hypothetical protein